MAIGGAGIKVARDSYRDAKRGPRQMAKEARPGHTAPAPGMRPRCPLCRSRKGSRPCPRYVSTICQADCRRVRSLSLCPKDCRYLGDLLKRAHAPSDDTIYR